MITDIIVGSGWPFGGEFLKEDEIIQRVITNKISFNGGTIINESSENKQYPEYFYDNPKRLKMQLL